MRTSIGIPEGLSHTLLLFTLYYVLKSLKTERWVYRACAAVFMTVTILFYHFTLAILAAFLALLPFLARFGAEKRDLKVLGSVLAPAVLLSGGLWYFWVTGSFVRTYYDATYPGYQAAYAGISSSGFFYTLGYSIGKVGAAALSTLGFTMTVLAFSELVGLIFFRKARKMIRMETRFLLAYLVAMALLAFVFQITYIVTGIAGTGITRLYIFSYLAMPVAAFASQTIVKASETVQSIVTQSLGVVRGRRFMKGIPVVITVLVCLVNLSAVNYYKAWSGKGIGLLESHYYVKFLTDEEYYALAYLRDNTPGNAIIFVVGVEEGILTHQVTVSRRTMVSITDLVDEGKFIIVNVTVMYPQLISEHCQGKIRINGEGAEIYFIGGIKKVSSELAMSDEPPPPKKIAMEHLLTDKILSSKGYECVYRNNQVTVSRVVSLSIEYVRA